MQYSVVAHGREGLLLNASRTQFNALKHAWIENVDPSIDPVSHKLDWLLHKTIDS